jgi:hypothetical protein
MHFICRSFIGTPDKSNWSQYWENEPDDLSIISQKGHLFGLINLEAPEDYLDINSSGHEIISKINRYYFFNDNTDNPLNSLKNALSSFANDPICFDINVSLLITVVCNNQVYFGTLGAGEIILNRLDKISRLLSGQKNEIKTLSGPVFSKDKIFLSTDSFYKNFSWEKIKNILADDKIENIEENFLSSLYSFDNQTGLAAALIEAELDETENVFNTNTNTDIDISANIIEEKPQIKIDQNPKIKTSFFKKIKKFFPKKEVYISHHETPQTSKRKKINLIIAVLLLIGLGVSVFFGYKKNKASAAESQYQQFKQDLDKKLSDAFAVKNLNFDSALELAKESESIYNKISQLKIHSDELSPYQNKINSLLSQTGSTSSFSPNIFYDASLIIDNPKFSKIILKNNSLYLFDNSLGRIDLVDINQKNTKNISTDSRIKSALGFTENNDAIYLVGDKDISLVTKNNIDSKINFSDLNKNINPVSVKSWNGAFYLLDSANSTIWKFNPNSSGFGVGQIWLKDTQSPISNPASLAINGNIWVLSENGQIIPFSKGIKEDFKPKQDIKFTKTNNLVTTVNTDFLAFTDNQNLIFVYKKSGDLVAKYNFDNKKIFDIAIDEKSNSLFVLCTDEKIYKINL